jgi:predicted RNA methylase
MDREARRRIQQVVLACRRVLEEEWDALLTLHGITRDGTVEVPEYRREVHRRLLETLAREGGDRVEARRRYIRHAAFTFLNRLLALRVAEGHGLIKETVATRLEFGGRSLRERDLADSDPNLAVRPEGLAHAALLEAFSEMRQLVPLLFHEEDPYALLLPRLPAYRRVRQELERLPEELWREFETLGWAYQYFNSEEREAIRRRLRRNPRPDDIPPLNQFYTVGWIVQALVHNTIGCLWLEAHPDSPLRAKLDYLVPVRNSFRPPARRLSVEKFKVLDPACGSGHFLLGAFDLLLEMWREEHPDLPPWQIPALVLEHNLYGIDIDLRACQIAAVALYLKARTAFEQLRGEDPSARFELRRINIVCADIRYRHRDGQTQDRFLEEFRDDPDLREIVRHILEDCVSAYEIGALLRIRRPLEQLFQRRQMSRTSPGRLSLLPRAEQLILSGALVPPPKRWAIEEIEDRLRAYLREAAETHDMGSLLFGLDAERAVRLADLLTDRYDVVLMNPPYGAMPGRCKEYAREHYPRTHNDYYGAFIEQAVDLCRDGGYVGALTGRTFLFLKSFQRLREEVLREEALPEVVWDLGLYVLDEATARYAAFTLRKRWEGDGVDWERHPVVFFRLTDWEWDEKRVWFEQALADLMSGVGV